MNSDLNYILKIIVILFHYHSNVKYILISLILVPPSSINITGYSEGSRVEIKEHDELSMSCKVSGAKPKPQIVWFKNGIPFIPGKLFQILVFILFCKCMNKFKK